MSGIDTWNNLKTTPKIYFFMKCATTLRHMKCTSFFQTIFYAHHFFETTFLGKKYLRN